MHAGRKERPKLFTSHQKGELQALVGPEWRQLGVDIEQHKKWSARAVGLLQAIDGTPDRALSDVHWTALLCQAYEAVKQVQVLASQIEIPSATLRSPHSFVRVHEGPGGLTKDWLTQARLASGAVLLVTALAVAQAPLDRRPPPCRRSPSPVRAHPLSRALRGNYPELSDLLVVELGGGGRTGSSGTRPPRRTHRVTGKASAVG